MASCSSFNTGYQSSTCLAPSWAGRGGGGGGGGYCSSSVGDPARVSRQALLRPSPPKTFFDPKKSDTCVATAGSGTSCGGYARLPPVSIPGQICGNHPRDDCCRVPRPRISMEDYCCPEPSCPCEPAANCVELNQIIRKKENYEPPCVPFAGSSLYRTDFQGCYGPKVPSYKPGTTVGASDARMDGCSTYRDSFPWKTGDTVRFHKEKEEFCPPCTPFDGSSTYRLDFRGFCGSRSPSYKPGLTTDSSDARFEGISSYRNEFVPYCPAEVNYARGVSVKPSAGGPDMSCSPFACCSTYQMDFVPKYYSKPPIHKPKNKSGFSSAAFCGRSTYRNDYAPYYFQSNCNNNRSSNECFMPSSCC